MARIALPLSLSALALALGACATPEDYATTHPAPVASTSPAATTVVASGQPVLISSGPVQPGTPIVPATNTFRAGHGTIESIAMVHILPATSASTGASAAQRLAYRVTVRMDDGSMQAVDQDNRGFMVGDQVEITGDGHVIRR